MADHNEYLAVNVLSDGHTVNYRMLSRALKVHSNRAKQLLYDFYTRQNNKRSGSLFATYIISGRQRQLLQTNGFHSQLSEDNPIPSSPFPSSSAPEQSQDDAQQQSWSKVLALAKETDLEKAKASIDVVDCVHIYSISPTAISDLFTLSECTRKVRVEHADEDPLEKWAQYGTIQNPNVWRRTREGQPVPAPVARPPAVPQLTTSETSSQAAVTAEPSDVPASGKPEPLTTTTTDAATSRSGSSSQSKAVPPTLRKERSSIMASFAKSKPLPAKKPESVSQVDDADVLSDEDMLDDDDDGLMDLDSSAVDQVKSEGKSKREREDELRKMMDEEDKGSADAGDDVEMRNAGEPAEAEPAEVTADESDDDDAAAKVEVSDGRRRGRRRVMKKKTVKDDEGYLAPSRRPSLPRKVTREEAVWESFSETDTPAPKKAKSTIGPAPVLPAAAATGKASDQSAATGKKGGKGQNSIMSFFAKK